LWIADCGLNHNEPAAGHASFAVNPQFAIRNPQWPAGGHASFAVNPQFAIRNPQWPRGVVSQGPMKTLGVFP